MAEDNSTEHPTPTEGYEISDEHFDYLHNSPVETEESHPADLSFYGTTGEASLSDKAPYIENLPIDSDGRTISHYIEYNYKLDFDNEESVHQFALALNNDHPHPIFDDVLKYNVIKKYT